MSRKMKKILFILVLSFFVSCSTVKKSSDISKEEIFEDLPEPEEILEDKNALDILEEEKIDVKEFKSLIEKPLYEFTPEEIDEYLRFLHDYEPDLRKRVDHLAKNFSVKSKFICWVNIPLKFMIRNRFTV